MTQQTAQHLARTVFGLTTLGLVGNILLAAVNTTGPDPVPGGATLAACAFHLTMFTFAVAGVLIAQRQPRNAVGWIMLAIGLVWQFPSEDVVRYGMVTAPGSLLGIEVLAVVSGPMWVPGVGLIGTFLLLLFPDGHLPSPRWRPVAWGSAASLLLVMAAILVAPTSLREVSSYEFVPVGTPNPLGVAALQRFDGVVSMLVLLVPLSIVACAYSVVVRFRRARGRERRQLMWLAVSGVVTAAAYLAAMILSARFSGGSAWAGDVTPTWLAAIQNTVVFVFALVPIAVGIAILRHRLYDIDVIVNRALVYGGLTATLAAVYAVGVLGIGVIARTVTGQERGSLAVAASTLVVAGLFTPLRARIQAGIDRRFYRRRYDAQRAVQDFTLRVREPAELASLQMELVRTLDVTVQPATVALWVSPTSAAVRPTSR